MAINVSPHSSYNLRTIFLNIILAILYAGFGKLSFIASAEYGNVTSVFFPPEGIALAFFFYLDIELLLEL